VRRLEGRRALVTGASSGIGAATAHVLAREGADVALLARGDGLAVVAERVRREGVRAVELRVDVGDRAALELAVADAVEQLGGLDVAVVGAAAAAFGHFQEIPARDFDRCVQVTFGGAVDTIRAVLPHLERSGGRLVVIGSAADLIGLPLLSPYVAAKHALDGFVDSLRADLRARESSVAISVVRPGAVDTPFWRHLAHPAGLTPPAIPPPTAYSAATVAHATVACAIEPRRAITIGGATRMLQLANAVAQPLTERALALAGRLSRARATPDDVPSALWTASGDGTLDGGLHGRPSLLVALRLRGARLRMGGR
jgi:NAD(P)-dependent dehydrogenase (short-subunit alcohol dehydrogenase family)